MRLGHAREWREQIEELGTRKEEALPFPVDPLEHRPFLLRPLVLPPFDGAQHPAPGEPLACAANIIRRSAVRTDDRVAAVGFGYIAAVVVQLLLAGRAREWVAISRRPESRALALQLGAAEAYGYDEVPAALWDSFPVVIEATGVQRALDYATWLTAYGGRLVIAGYHADGPRTVNMQSWNWKGIDVVNAHERQPSRYIDGLREGLRLVQRHQLPLASLITHRWPLEQAGRAFAAEQRPGGYVKGIVSPWEG